jgi:hypothetical protein
MMNLRSEETMQVNFGEGCEGLAPGFARMAPRYSAREVQ